MTDVYNFCSLFLSTCDERLVNLVKCLSFPTNMYVSSPQINGLPFNELKAVTVVSVLFWTIINPTDLVY